MAGSKVQRGGTARTARDAKRRHKRPCRSAPATPTGITLTFVERSPRHSREERWDARVKWDAVTTDVAGRPLNIEAYQVKLRATDASGVPVQIDGVDHDFWRKRVDDDDRRVRFVNLPRPRHWYYQTQVRALNRIHGGRCWSLWSGWTMPMKPFTPTPPQPTDVTIFDRSTDRVVLDWTAPEDPDDADLIHVDVDFFQAQISKSPTFGSVYKFDKRIGGTRKAFKVHPDDIGDIFYGRIRSGNSDGEKSAYIPATLTGNSSPGASPSGVAVGKSTRVAFTWTKPGEVEAKHYEQSVPVDQRYDIVGIRARAGRHDAATHPADGCPTGSDMLLNLWVEDAGSTSSQKILAADSRLRIDAGTHKDAAWIRKGDSNFLVTQLQENESVSVNVAQVGSTNPGRNMVVVLILEPA
jgi:hypothetical protein